MSAGKRHGRLRLQRYESRSQQLCRKSLRKILLALLALVLVAHVSLKKGMQQLVLPIDSIVQKAVSNGTDSAAVSTDILLPPPPNVVLYCRSHSTSTSVLTTHLLPSLSVFWSNTQWPHSKLLLVWDSDDEEQLREKKKVESIIQKDMHALVPTYHVVTKAPPQGSMCENWRSSGYAWQQFSTFVMDNDADFIVEDEDWIAVVDSDAFLISPVVPEDLFVYDDDDNQWKARIKGYNSYGTRNSQLASCSVKIGLGEAMIGEFMFPNLFPVLVKARHLKLIRDKMVDVFRQHNHTTTLTTEDDFAWVFHRVCSECGPEKYSQFDIMLTALWYCCRKEYAWELRDGLQFNGTRWRGRASSDEAVLNTMTTAFFPTVMKHKHLVHRDEVRSQVMEALVCLADHTNPCNRHNATFNKQELVDYMYMGSRIKEREYVMSEDYMRAYEKHMQDVKARGFDFGEMQRTARKVIPQLVALEQRG